MQLLQECDSIVGRSDDCEWPEVEFKKTWNGSQMAHISLAKKPDAYCSYGVCETCKAWVELTNQGEPSNLTVEYNYYAGEYSFDGIHSNILVNGLEKAARQTSAEAKIEKQETIREIKSLFFGKIFFLRYFWYRY